MNIQNLKRGFAPLAVLMVIGAFVATGIFVFTPQADTFADDPVCESQVVPNGSGGFDVTPLDNWPADVTNVQCALDNVTPGSTVLLKAGTFNFGPNDEDVLGRQVFLKKSVTVTGEVEIDDQGKITDWLTKIHGGSRSFFFLDKDADIIVENLWFNENLFSALQIQSANTATARFCKITNSQVGLAFATQLPSVYGIVIAEIAFPYLGVPFGSLGKVYAIENYIDIFNPDENNFTGDLNHSAGIMPVIILPPFGKEVHLIGNEIHNPGTTSIASIGAFGATVYASGNKIYQRDDYDFTYTGPTVSSQGIGNAGWTHPFTGAQFPAAKAVFTGNFIYNIPTVGMSIFDTSNSTVKNNYIEMKNAVEGSMGIKVAKFDKAGTSNTLFEGNTIEGTADYGIYMFDDANSNTFAGNDLSGFHAKNAQVYLGPESFANTFLHNILGNILDQAEAGLKCEGVGNTFEQNEWVVNFPAWPSGKGLWWMTGSSKSNEVIDPVVTGGVKPDKHWKNEGPVYPDVDANTLNGL